MNGKKNNGANFPGIFQSQLVQVKKFRYQVTSSPASEDDVTIGCLRAQLFVKSNTASSTGAMLIFQSVRIRKVEIWGVKSTTGTDLCNVGLIWSGLNAPVSEFFSSGDNARPAHLSLTPPKNSQCSWWHDFSATQTTSLMKITAPVGSIIELTLEYVLHDGTNGDDCTLGAATTAIGVFASCLDCLSVSNLVGNNVIQPVGLTTLALASI